MSYHTQSDFNGAVAHEVTLIREDLDNIRGDLRAVREQMDDIRSAVRDVSSVAHRADKSVSVITQSVSIFMEAFSAFTAHCDDEIVDVMNDNFQSHYDAFQRVESFLDDIDSRLLELEGPDDSTADEDTAAYFDIESYGEPEIRIELIGDELDDTLGDEDVVSLDALYEEMYGGSGSLIVDGTIYAEESQDQDPLAAFDKLNTGNTVELPLSPQPAEDRDEEITRARAGLAAICTSAYVDAELFDTDVFYPLLEIVHGRPIAEEQANKIPGSNTGQDNEGSQLAQDWWFDRVAKIDLDNMEPETFCDFICSASILMMIYNIQ